MLVSGCATVGDTEALNDTSMRDVREAAQIFTTTREVLGIPVERNGSATINRGYGHANNMKTYPDSKEDIPQVIKGYDEMMRYLEGMMR